MTEQERGQLRASYIADYAQKTGIKLKCIEETIRPIRCIVACTTNIVRLSAEYTRIDEECILGDSRKAGIVEIRRWIAATMVGYRITHERIAYILGDKDPSTITVALQMHKNLMLTDQEYNERYKKYRKQMRYKIQEIHNSSKKDKITNKMKWEIKRKKAAGMNNKEIGELYSIHQDTVSKIVNNRYPA